MTPMDPAALNEIVQQVMAWLRDHLPLLPAAAAGETAAGVAKAAGSDLWGKLKEFFRSAEKEEVASALEASPEHPGKQKKFEGELYELLEQNPEFTREVQSLLVKAPMTLVTTQSGSGNKAAQVAGSTDVKIEIG